MLEGETEGGGSCSKEGGGAHSKEGGGAHSKEGGWEEERGRKGEKFLFINLNKGELRLM